jgi:hypothetical protein
LSIVFSAWPFAGHFAVNILPPLTGGTSMLADFDTKRKGALLTGGLTQHPALMQERHEINMQQTNPERWRGDVF